MKAMEIGLGRLKRCIFSGDFLSVSFFCFVVLVTAFHAHLSQAINLSAGGFHPTQVLSSSSLLSISSSLAASSTSSSERINSAIAMPGDEIQEEEVLHHFRRNGRSRRDYQKPSTTFMVSLFNELQRGGTLKTGRSAQAVTDTIRSFSGQNSKETRKGRPVVDFYIPYLPPHERLRNAEIRFLRNPKVKAKSKKYKFRIDVRKSGKIVNKFVLRQRSVIQHQYDVFDVSKIVSPWINSFHGNISLHVRVSKKLKSQTLVASKDSSLVVLYLEDSEFLKNMYTSFTSDDDIEVSEASKETLSRRKRTLPDSYGSSSSLSHSVPLPSSIRNKRDTKKRKRRNRKNRRWYRAGRKENCQLYDFQVDFHAIGWGQWIIRPEKFNARFCFGLCPSPIDSQYKPTNHAMLQTLMRMKRPNIAPMPCCVPTKLSPVSMLYFEYDEVVLRYHEDMVAEECGCR